MGISKNYSEHRALERIDTESRISSDSSCAVLSTTLASIVERLRIGRGLLHALTGIELAAWESSLNTAEGRATAFAVSALTYGDLTDEEYEALYSHIGARAAIQRALLRDKFGADHDSLPS